MHHDQRNATADIFHHWWKIAWKPSIFTRPQWQNPFHSNLEFQMHVEFYAKTCQPAKSKRYQKLPAIHHNTNIHWFPPPCLPPSLPPSLPWTLLLYPLPPKDWSPTLIPLQKRRQKCKSRLSWILLNSNMVPLYVPLITAMVIIPLPTAQLRNSKSIMTPHLRMLMLLPGLVLELWTLSSQLLPSLPTMWTTQRKPQHWQCLWWIQERWWWICLVD